MCAENVTTTHRGMATPGEREAEINLLAEEFNEHVLTARGMWLDASVRLQICHSARSFNEPAASFTDPTVRRILSPIIHKVINEQAGINEQWYRDSISALNDLTTAPAHDAADNHTIFCEVLLLAAMSFGITTFYRGINKPCPALPTNPLPEPPQPLALRVSDISCNQPRFDATYNFCPFYLASDVKPELKSLISTRAWDAIAGFMNATAMTPLNSATWAIEDTGFFVHAMTVMYVPEHVVRTPWVPLEPHHCSGVQRCQIELAAEAVAAAYACAF